jgi:hypothetical protein
MSDNLKASVATDASAHESAEQQILRAISSIDYGSVEITIHDGRIVQIECREKIRLGGGDQPRKTPLRPLR